ncbi:hypothetical protein PVAND_014798 [Polypedilum vanderplanki]|uniref:Major facilitator superfamily (MFS) profile domain-containing protein n=1 Tax=Polypedilum vanderplanki TaxID=319348 RepID=A0A9J6BAF3_POLVA|nr:hypothetical protein PVAND_014798 [Polypedilum vanderplanki]
MCKSENLVPSVSEVKIENDKKENLKIINFDEALSRTGFGKFNYFLVILSGIVLTAVLLETLSISFVMPVAEYDLNLTTENKGILSSVAYAGIIASSHLSGFLADTKGRRKIIMFSLLLSFLCTIVSSFIENFWGFAVMRFLCGFFISGSSTTIYAYLGEFHDIRKQSKVVMGAAFVFGIGCICVPLLALLIINQEWSFYISFLDIDYKPWRLFVAVCGSLSLFSGICFIFLPESPKFIHSQGNNEKTLEILRKVYKWNSGKSIKCYEVNEIESDKTNDKKTEKYNWVKKIWHQTAPLFQKDHVKNTFLLCSIQFLIFITSAGLYMFFPEILNRSSEFMQIYPSSRSTICHALEMTKITPNLIETIVNKTSVVKLEIETYEYAFLLEIIYAIGFALIGILVNTLGKLPIIFFILFGCALCAAAVSFVSIMTLSIYLYVILLACGLAVNVITTSTIELFPTNLRAMAISLSLMFGRLGSIFGTNVTSLLLDNYCEFTFLFSFFTLTLSCFLVFHIPNISYRISRECNSSNNTSVS